MTDYYSKYFTKTLKDSPKDEESINAKLLMRGGFISKQMAGVFTLLPLGLKVVNKINKIIREELNSIGCQEVSMPAFQSKELWEKTDRWNTDNNIMYQMKDNSGKDIGLGYTHEEVITEIATKYIHSYKDLPQAIYQIQTKFRDEPRAKSGILRGREFLMKDLYSFHIDENDRDKYYDKVKQAYENIFKRLGVKAIVTFASGGSFSKYSHEFQIISESGEDTIWLCEKCQQAVNNEIIDEYGKNCHECKSKLVENKSIEVGNIFKLGTRFSKALGLYFADAKGNKNPVEMASYGIGPTRAMGSIVEVSHDDKGIIWGETVAPYDIHIINFKNQRSKIKDSNQILKILEDNYLDILIDDREEVSFGEKLKDADLIGIPYQIILGEKSKEGEVELKERKNGESNMIEIDKIISRLKH